MRFFRVSVWVWLVIFQVSISSFGVGFYTYFCPMQETVRVVLPNWKDLSNTFQTKPSVNCCAKKVAIPEEKTDQSDCCQKDLVYAKADLLGAYGVIQVSFQLVIPFSGTLFLHQPYFATDAKLSAFAIPLHSSPPPLPQHDANTYRAYLQVFRI
ncbi:MAG TPA: hypothetical protein DCM08_12240 [Microscillaceae bacterium]|jgi:hypothetical protein|nr:hypothetical protein [Microscillaceae bacterium]